MSYIVREDGEHFVVPSYRDVITAKSTAAFKKEILSLSNSYGQYITLQTKGPLRYEVAYSSDTGYLLGESIWFFLKCPIDLIYCEAIPDTTEVVLVIVKNGSVYLDGRFPAEGVQEELVSFLTQENQFAIYIYGNVPISKTPEAGKFSFEEGAVKSFTVLETPLLKTLPLYKQYQLQLVASVLKKHGIGVFPVKQVATTGAILGIIAMIVVYCSTRPAAVVEQPSLNPYETYNATLLSPAPDQAIQAFMDTFERLFTLPGWVPVKVDYAQGMMTASVKSYGSSMGTLSDWATRNHATVSVNTDGVLLTLPVMVPSRSIPQDIYPLKQVIMHFVDNLAFIYPGNHLSLNDFSDQGVYSKMKLTISLEQLSPIIIRLIGDTCKALPLTLDNISLTIDESALLSGSVVLQALGN